LHKKSPKVANICATQDSAQKMAVPEFLLKVPDFGKLTKAKLLTKRLPRSGVLLLIEVRLPPNLIFF
jgi:hypothetical protein